MMKNLVGRLVKEEEGQGLTEYGMLVGLIALIVVGTITLIGKDLLEVFQKIQTEVNKL
ncbi:Flp family type IVb pilin [Bacillus sp. JJ1566]|uniref:Flp family type IVb pilin n=1 Tax=Bacillus sp. JJ1566 TaxID=3122961 RepID=UPI002FFF3D5D